MHDLEKKYYLWMYNIVCNDHNSRSLTFHKLMEYLQNIEFKPLLEQDKNRAQYGIDFRYRFGYENKYSRSDIDKYLSKKLGPCRMLEMMVSLAFAIEESVMDDPDYGNRTGQWFWNMIVSLGLGSMDDSQFVKTYVDKVIFRFMNRDYNSNGRGGLFTLNNPPRNLRFVEIWDQAMLYLDENYDFTV